MTSSTGIEWNDEEARRALEQAPQTFRAVMRPALHMMLAETKKELVKVSPGREGGEGNLASSWQEILAPGSELFGAVRAGVPYAIWADEGRGPGKMPPYDPIEQWVHRLGLGGRATGVEREQNRLPHRETGPREPREARGGRNPRREHGELDREEIIWLIRRKIGARGTYTPKPPPHFSEKARKNVYPRLEAIFDDAVGAFVAAVSTG